MKNNGYLHIRTPQTFLDQLKEFCNDNNIDRSKWIRNCLERELERAIFASKNPDPLGRWRIKNDR